MENFYRILGTSPTASATELEAAIDALYQENLRKANAHNRDVADEANRMLRLLEEEIRPTLADPARRSTYDAGIGLGGAVGGLADLSALLEGIGTLATRPAPASPEAAARAPSATAGTSLWTCPAQGCRADNPPHTRYCFKCGAELVRECPECGGMTSLVATQMCGACGYSHQVATQRRDLRVRMTPLEQECQRLQTAVDTPPEMTTKQILIMVAPSLPGIIGVTSEGLGRVFGWIWLVICLIGLVWWMRRWKARLDGEKQASRQVLEAKVRELDSLEQEYGRLALLRTKA